MLFKKLLSILLILCMVISFAACGGKTSDDDEEDEGSKTTSKDKADKDNNNDDDDGDDKDKDDEDEDKDKDDDEDEDKDNDEDEDDDDKDDDSGSLGAFTGDAVEIPKGFPKDIFPIYKGGVVIYGTVDNSQGYDKYSIMANCPDTVDKVTAFYQTELAKTEDKTDSKGDGFYSVGGKLGGYSYSLLVMGESGKKECVVTMEVSVIPTGEDALNTVDEVDIPEDYPISDFPLVDDAKVVDASESESDGQVYYDLSVYTLLSFKEIVAFYEEKLGTIEDKDKSVGSDDFTFSGRANGYSFYMNGYKTSVSNTEVTSYYISLDPIDEE